MSRMAERHAELADMAEPGPPGVEETMRRMHAWAQRQAAADEVLRAERLACLSRIAAARARERFSQSPRAFAHH